MEVNDFNSKSIDELWYIYGELAVLLGRKITAEKDRLEDRLRKIEGVDNVTKRDRVRRAYPKVHPKYQNPRNPAESWAGRGKQPRWLKAQLRNGKKLQDFVIER